MAACDGGGGGGDALVPFGPDLPAGFLDASFGPKPDLAADMSVPLDLSGVDIVCPPEDAALPTGVPGEYEVVIVTDPWPCGPDPRCHAYLGVPRPGEACTFPGLACEFFGITIACDCDRVAHCYDDPDNGSATSAGPDMGP